MIPKVVMLTPEHFERIEATLAAEPERYRTEKGRVSGNELIRQALDVFFSCEVSVPQDGQ